ncbi:hypothetical protein JHK86_045848 [Glycine max]|nr:hypothetical protein JHK86_045848 [Glycine max]
MLNADSTSPYHPTAKPSKPTTTFFKKTNLYTLLAFLCIVSYLLGAYQGTTTKTTITTTTTTPCPQNPTLTTTTHLLDFSSHHNSTNLNPSTSTTLHFPPCHVSLSEYTPCEDHARSLQYSRRRMVYRERHCPRNNEVLKCRVPAPHGYRNPFPWPASRDVAWYANVPHRELTVEKAVQNWIRYDGDRFHFPGGGTMFPDGADKYIDDIADLVNLRDGTVRTAVDTGCGCWFNFFPLDELDGLYLNEIDRILRPGGYWILSGPPIRWKKHWKGWERTKEDLNKEQTKIENAAKSLCWNKLVEKDDIAIWQKAKNHLDCKSNRKLTQNRPFCKAQNNPDKAWYTDMQTCLSPMPEVSSKEETAGGALKKWPERLKATPPRISRGTIKGVNPETFSKDNELWKKRVAYYKKANNQLGKAGRYRNLLDMNAYLGGFAAALVDLPVWVMNVVPVQAKVDTLGAIYERGLIGTYHNWCEAMSTYPRTYDLIHADSLFSLYNDRCELEDILLEMDRILRPEGSVIIRDDVDILVKVKSIVNGMDWDSQIVDHEDGPLEREKLLFAVKNYWTAPAASDKNS